MGPGRSCEHPFGAQGRVAHSSIAMGAKGWLASPAGCHVMVSGRSRRSQNTAENYALFVRLPTSGSTAFGPAELGNHCSIH